MKAFFSFMIRWVIPVLGLIALGLIIWFVGPLLDVLVPEGRRWALIILVFAASQGLLWAGIAATFAMALGTALTTGALAALAVFFKFAALRLAGGGSLRCCVAEVF